MTAIDLPIIWAFIIAFAVFVYVVMDGFDLGLGILYPLFPNKTDRDVIMNSVAPVWDGNETWLVLGGGGLMAAFPLLAGRARRGAALCRRLVGLADAVQHFDRARAGRRICAAWCNMVDHEDRRRASR